MAEERLTKVMRTLTARIHAEGEGTLPALVKTALAATITSVGSAIQHILGTLEGVMTVEEDDEGISHIDLEVELAVRDVRRAKENAAKPRQQAAPDATTKEHARPKYKNAYRLEEVIERGAVTYGRFEIARRFSWQGVDGGRRSQLDHIPAKFFQQVIMSWLRPRLDDVPKLARAGTCQQAAQQLLSHIGLLVYTTHLSRVSYPTLEERRPEVRLASWRDAVARIKKRITQFPYQTARTLTPWKYGPDDPRGDRLVNVDEDWLLMTHSPVPHPLPLIFSASKDVIVYERRWEEPFREGTRAKRWLYVALPLFEGVRPQSPLGRLAEEQKLFSWRRHVAEFRPLGVWEGRRLNPRRPLLVVQLGYDPDELKKQSRFRTLLEGQNGRRVNWSVLIEREYRRGDKRYTGWEVHFVTSRGVKPLPRPFTLGVHFALEPIVFWSLAALDGSIVQRGRIEGNPVLSSGLATKLRLEEEQGRLRWVGNRRYSEALKQHTYAVCRSILALAGEKNANLAIEDIAWVDKKSGGPDANRRFSLWNYGRLREMLQWLGLDRKHPADGQPIMTVRRVSDYLLRYTCPSCGTCRKGGVPEERAITWRRGATLLCRNCGYEGAVLNETQADLVANLGAERARALARSRA